jgi:hypothetical protein
VDPNVPNTQYPNQGAPGAPQVPPPWGQPAPPPWGQPAPTQSPGGGVAGRVGRSIVSRVIGFVVVIAVLGGGAYLYNKIANPDHLNQVIFTTTDQGSNSNCDVTNRISSVKSGSPIYVMVMWSHKLSASDVVVEEDLKDGVSLSKSSDNWSAADYSGYDCTTDPHNYAQAMSVPGSYEIKLTVGTEVVADGTLTVTP